MSARIPQTMSGVQLTGHGGPEKLVWNDAIPVPQPGPGEVLVRVAAAGVNNTDINTRIGWYSSDVTGATDQVQDDADIETGGWGGALDFPRIQGGDICGYVVANGQGTDRFALNSRVTCPINLPRPTVDNPVGCFVLGSEVDGAFAEFCVVDAGDLFDVSASPLSDIEIGAMPCAHGTAWNMVTRAGVKAGENVLISGASGGVGIAAVALASHLGARVTAQCSSSKADAVRAAGASHVIDRGAVPEPRAFDAWIDIVGGPGWPAGLLALKPGGRLAISGAIAGPIVAADLRDIYLRDITIYGATFQRLDTFAGLVDLINQGAIRPLVSKTYPLKDIARAQQDFASKHYPGKLVLIP